MLQIFREFSILENLKMTTVFENYLEQKKRRRAWIPGGFSEVATGALQLLP